MVTRLQRRPRRPPGLKTGAIVVLLCLAACGGGHSPTAPASPLPQIAGSWSGTFGLGFFGLRASMRLAQADDGTVQGLLLIFPNDVNIVGTVSATSFSFHSVGNCLTVNGTLALTQEAGSVTQMSGTTSQDFAPCGAPSGHPQVGHLSMFR